ncbi:hypothetical protein PO124_22190 [Bacillus licheniformis]|nr:hypothetical protein [Bacillus licheniformis]
MILAVIGARVYKGGVLMYTSGGGLKISNRRFVCQRSIMKRKQLER